MTRGRRRYAAERQRRARRKAKTPLNAAIQEGLGGVVGDEAGHGVAEDVGDCEAA